MGQHKGREKMKHDELPIFQKWTHFLGWLVDVTQKFPRRVRFTFSSRLDNLALDVLEKIIEAAYSKDKIGSLRQINLNIEKLRVLLRLCNEKQFLSDTAYRHAIYELFEAGKMVGGWIKKERVK